MSNVRAYSMVRCWKIQPSHWKEWGEGIKAYFKWVENPVESQICISSSPLFQYPAPASKSLRRWQSLPNNGHQLWVSAGGGARWRNNIFLQFPLRLSLFRSARYAGSKEFRRCFKKKWNPALLHGSTERTHAEHMELQIMPSDYSVERASSEDMWPRNYVPWFVAAPIMLLWFHRSYTSRGTFYCSVPIFVVKQLVWSVQKMCWKNICIPSSGPCMMLYKLLISPADFGMYTTDGVQRDNILKFEGL